MVCKNDVIEKATWWHHKLTCKTWWRFKLAESVQHLMLKCVSDQEIHQICIFLMDHWSPYAIPQYICNIATCISWIAPICSAGKKILMGKILVLYRLVNNYGWGLSGKVLASRPRDRGLEPHRRHCVVSLNKKINPCLVLVQPRKTHPFITERLLMGRKESNKQNNYGNNVK